MKFAKYHGLGNDFVVVDLRGGGSDAKRVQNPDVVRRLCARRFGIGADGILAILAAETRGAAATMRVLNADGSTAEMCGNGIRCVIKHLVERTRANDRTNDRANDRTNDRANDLVVDTGAGPLRCEVERGRHGEVARVRVDMGHPRLKRAEIPMLGESENATRTELDGVDGLFTAVSMGNPHAIQFFENGTGASELRERAERDGPRVEEHPAFPQRTNAEFASIVGESEIELVVWERGCGITLACGTGACATAVAACVEGRAKTETPITIHLPGGDLEIEVATDLATVFMTGPVAHVFDGDLGHFLDAPECV